MTSYKTLNHPLKPLKRGDMVKVTVVKTKYKR